MYKSKCIVIILLIICSLCVCVYAEDLTGLQEQSGELSKQLNETNNRLQAVQDEISQNMQQLQEVDNQISQSQEALDEVNVQIDEVVEEIKENEEKLQKIQKEQDDMQELLDKRIIALYKAPKLRNLDILLKSKSITEFLGNYYAIKKLTEYDNKLLTEAKERKIEIETTKQILLEKKKQVVIDKQTQQKKSQILANTKTMREYYLSKLTTEELELQSQIDEYNSQVSEIEAEIKLLALNSISKDYIGGAMNWPVPGYTSITSEYGMRVHPITGAYKLHTGVDIGAPIGTSFVAAANGIVSKATYNPAYGNMVIIDHGGGVQTLYAHGNEIVAQVGQTVARGDEVLKVGSTGYSTGPHAHFEIRINGQTVNPIEFLTKINALQEKTQTEEN